MLRSPPPTRTPGETFMEKRHSKVRKLIIGYSLKPSWLWLVVLRFQFRNPEVFTGLEFGLFMWASLHYSHLSPMASLFNLTDIIRAKYSILQNQTPKPFSSPFWSAYPANNELSLVIMNNMCSLEIIVSHPRCFINFLESQSLRVGTPDFQSHLDQQPYFANKGTESQRG